MRLYAFLGQRLAAEQQGSHAYSDWVQTYASAGFAALAARLETLLDRYALQTTATAAAYGYAMDCEQAFFSAAWAR
jgi:thiaminase/transcriptional activator TenA